MLSSYENRINYKIIQRYKSLVQNEMNELGKIKKGESFWHLFFSDKTCALENVAKHL